MTKYKLYIFWIELFVRERSFIMSLLQNGLLERMVNEYHLFSEIWQYNVVFIASVILTIVVSYLLGSINSAIIISKKN